jgi:hypothetical protein
VSPTRLYDDARFFFAPRVQEEKQYLIKGTLYYIRLLQCGVGEESFCAQKAISDRPLKRLLLAAGFSVA